MNPRDNFIHDLFDGLNDYRQWSASEIKARIEAVIAPHYAIGRWVSVEERLPEFDTDGHWHGITRDIEGDVHACVCLKGVPLSNTATHWLDLDLPETEAGQ